MAEGPNSNPPPPGTVPRLVDLGWSDRVAALVAAADPPAGVVPGRVVRVERETVVVVTATAEEVAIGHPLPAVGDWVLVGGGGSTEPLGVVEVLPRWARLERHATGRATEVQVLAVNVDLVAIVVSLGSPINGSRIDRELVVAWESGGQPLVVLTKADAHPDPSAVAKEVADRAVGVDVVTTSSIDGRGLDALRAHLGPADTMVLLGASGVGKSTLANRLLGADLLATGAVRESDSKGRHTTVSRSLLPIPTGGVLIDTPGLRGLGLWDVTDGMDLAFPDITELAAECRFDDCAHEREPGCAVRAAVETGELSATRFSSWVKLQDEAARVDVQRAARAKADERRAATKRTRALQARQRTDDD